MRNKEKSYEKDFANFLEEVEQLFHSRYPKYGYGAMASAMLTLAIYLSSEIGITTEEINAAVCAIIEELNENED